MFVSVKTSFQLFARGMDPRPRASDNESSVPSPTAPTRGPKPVKPSPAPTI